MKKTYFVYFFLFIILFIIIFMIRNNVKESFSEQKIIIHKIMPEIKNKDAFPLGLGDILKGTISLYKISQLYGYKFYLDLTNHPIEKYFIQTIPDDLTHFKQKVHEYIIYFNIDKHNDLIPEVNKILETNDIGLFSTNCEVDISNELNENDRKNLQKIIHPSDYLKGRIDMVKKDLRLDNYSVLHIRTGDENINKGLNSKLIDSIEKILNKLDLPKNILLLSDSSELKIYLRDKYKFKILESEIIHLGYLDSNNKDEGIESTLTDFFLISGSNKIYSLSVYYWNSGFSKMASKIYNIPIETYEIK